MRKIVHFLIAALLSGVNVCAQAGPQRGERPEIQLENVPADAYSPGKLRVKFKPEVAQNLLVQINSNGFVQFGLPNVDAVNQRLKISAATMSFDAAYKAAAFHDQQKKAGFIAQIQLMNDWELNGWYELICPVSTDIKTAIAAYTHLAEIEFAEPDYKKSLCWLPNDPLFYNQWHYHNTAQGGGAITDKDIDLPEAWDLEKGNPDVIVSVHDGGIQFNHPDIAQNMWSGTGYNFFDNSPTITFSTHGTHVGGTIGAVNNNGVGVSGIAGGDGSPASGARIMTCEVFNPSGTGGGIAGSYAWAVNHGAVISQNSWGYTTSGVYDRVVLDAIDYFIANAGIAVSGPMQGGIAIFASGNSGLIDAPRYPGYYSKTICVSATNNQDIKPAYSNCGNYCDISAPGGGDNPTIFQGVESTVTNNGYGYMSGTSMAAPHVSGVAALLVSKLKGRISSTDLRALLLTTTDNHYPVNNPSLAGKLGTGRLNAFSAVKKAADMLAAGLVDAPSNIKAVLTAACDSVQLSWNNAAGNPDVLIAVNLVSDDFGLPFGNIYTAGQLLAGGGTIVFKGKASSFKYPVSIDGAAMNFQFWHIDGTGINYSSGQKLIYRVPHTVRSAAGMGGATNIQLNWARECPNSNIYLAYNTSPVFGTAPANPADATIAGGGIKLSAAPAATSFNHTGLQTDQFYYYAFYPYKQTGAASWVWGEPLVIRATTACPTSVLPVVQGFENAIFPPVPWMVLDGGPNRSLLADFKTWQRKNVGFGSANCAFVNSAVDDGQNSLETLRSPKFDITADIDSLLIDFDYAYRAWDASASFADSLEIAISKDCGLNKTVLWSKGGVTLATVAGFESQNGAGEYIPVQADWKHVSLNAKTAVQTGDQVNVLFNGINKFGQNIYIDNINIRKVPLLLYDLEAAAVLEPAANLLCNAAFMPKVKLVNNGRADTVRNYNFNWRINGGTATTIMVAKKLVRNAADTVLLPAINLAPGNYLFECWTSQPNGQADQIPANDTLRKQFTITGRVEGSLTEGFETATFPPAGWGLSNADNDITWQRTVLAAKTGNAAVFINNYNYGPGKNGRSDILWMPTFVPKTGIDSLFVNFQLAAAVNIARNSTDTLEILLTTNCGETFTPVYKKWGAALQTAANIQHEFVPVASQWRQETIGLTSLLPQLNNGFQLIFKSTNQYANNIFIDDVNLFGKTLPVQLKDRGYLIYPSPFSSSFMVQHYVQPLRLRGICVYNAAGQLVHRLRYASGAAPASVTVNMASGTPGMYTVLLQYDDKEVREKVLKLR